LLHSITSTGTDDYTLQTVAGVYASLWDEKFLHHEVLAGP